VLISYRRNFIFLSNPKCGSTTFESDWRSCCELAITGTRLGKHFTYKQLCTRLAFIFERAGQPPESFFRFGVIRDPVDRAVSWFNYRQRHRAELPPLKEALAAFVSHLDRDLTMLGSKNPYSYGQRGFYNDQENNLGVDYLIPLPRLAEESLRLKSALGIPNKTKKPLEESGGTLSKIRRLFRPVKVPRKLNTTGARRRNISPVILSRSDVPDNVCKRIEEVFYLDVKLYHQALDGQFGRLENAVAKKCPSEKR
jgi:hypothetical protein